MTGPLRKPTPNPWGFPEAAALGMVLLGVVPAWMSEGAGWALLSSSLATIITYLMLRSVMANRR